MKITKPIIVFGRKKKRAIRRACGIVSAQCLTNQNGKTVYNHKAGNYYDLTLKEVEMLSGILPKHKAKKAEKLLGKIDKKINNKAKMEVKK